jgi:hypothetical protein
MADTLSRFLLVLVGLIVSFDTLEYGVPADLLAVGFLVALVVVAVFKFLTLQEDQRAPTQ